MKDDLYDEETILATKKIFIDELSIFYEYAISDDKYSPLNTVR